MSSKDRQDLLYEAHAAVCRACGNPWRLRIVEALGDGERTVSDLVAALGVSKSNVSQHLAIMRRSGVVGFRREGGHVHYRLMSPKVLAACRLMREVLLEHFDRVGDLSRAERGVSYPVNTSGGGQP